MADTAEKDAGLLPKYEVTRLGDQTGKHDECRFFVLDPQHDPIAREALRDYAVHALSYGYVALYQDLDRWLTELASETDGSWACGRCGHAPESHAPGGGADNCVFDPAFTRVLPPVEGDR